MVGGLLNLIAVGPEDVILIGNPTKSFFTRAYSKYTNFGLQRFRIDFEGEREIQINEQTTFKFKIPRYADLLMDTYFVMNLPNIWSPIYSQRPEMQCKSCRTGISQGTQPTYSDVSGCDPSGVNLTTPQVYTYDIPYEFKWIENIGAQMLRSVRIMADDQILQEFTGQYLYAMVQRDFTDEKKKLFDEMIGNVEELNDPANYSNRNGNYPNASYMGFTEEEIPYGLEPSIRGRELYVPLNIWSTLSSKMALPLVSMQYSVLSIEIELRPITDLFVVRDIDKAIDLGYVPWSANQDCGGISADFTKSVPYIHPDCHNEFYSMYLFLKEPPPAQSWNAHTITGTIDPKNPDLYAHYYPWLTQWAVDAHLIGTYVFLDDTEVRQFATKCQSYLIREVHEQTVYDLVGQQYTPIRSVGLVASWMWFFQRTDAHQRNEWSNYSNWAYKKGPLQSRFNATYVYMQYLEAELRAAGSLENMRTTRPTEFCLIYILFILGPINLGDAPLISPFLPPSMYGLGIDGMAWVFDLMVIDIMTKPRMAEFVKKWYHATSGISPNSPDATVLSANIRSPYPLSHWSLLAGGAGEVADPSLICDWERPDISQTGHGFMVTSGIAGIPAAFFIKCPFPMIPTAQSSGYSYDWAGGTIEYHGISHTYISTTFGPLPSSRCEATMGLTPQPPFPLPPTTTTSWRGSVDAYPYCPMTCPLNDSLGAQGGWCACNVSTPPGTLCPPGAPGGGPVASPDWTDALPSACAAATLQPTAPKHWCEDYDANRSYQEMLDKFYILYNYVQYDAGCKKTMPFPGDMGAVFVTGNQDLENIRDIMVDWGFNLDETVRETVFPAGVANYMDKYTRTAGSAVRGLYCYNFCLDTNPFVFQPSGALNVSRFNNVAWSYRVMDPSNSTQLVPVSVHCDRESRELSGTTAVAGIPQPHHAGGGKCSVNSASDSSTHPDTAAVAPTGVSTSTRYWKNYQYAYNLHIMEERYNMLVIENGVARLALAR